MHADMCLAVTVVSCQMCKNLGPEVQSCQTLWPSQQESESSCISLQIAKLLPFSQLPENLVETSKMPAVMDLPNQERSQLHSYSYQKCRAHAHADSVVCVVCVA